MQNSEKPVVDLPPTITQPSPDSSSLSKGQAVDTQPINLESLDSTVQIGGQKAGSRAALKRASQVGPDNEERN